jgi:hypothetical protein
VLQHRVSKGEGDTFELRVMSVMDHIADDKTFLSEICSGEEAIIFICRNVDRDNIDIWRCINLHAVFANATKSLKKQTLFSSVSSDKL